MRVTEDTKDEQIHVIEDLITMANGCVCCSVRGDLIRTLGQLSKRRKDFDAILLETTGLADPAPIIYTIQTNPKMSDHYKIDSIICLAGKKGRVYNNMYFKLFFTLLMIYFLCMTIFQMLNI